MDLDDMSLTVTDDESLTATEDADLPTALASYGSVKRKRESCAALLILRARQFSDK